MDKNRESCPTVKKRDSNLELFRIITMLLIVAHHFVVNSGLTSDLGPIYQSPTSLKAILILLIGAWGKIGINCFMLITGYFMCKSKITAKKFTKLLLEVMFYKIVIYLIFLIARYEPFSLSNLVKALLPVYIIGNNFTGCFFVFYLFIPFASILVQHLNEKQHLRLLLLCGFAYIFFGTIKQIQMNYVSWFLVLFFIASYIRMYPKKSFDNTKLWGILTCLSVIIAALSVIVCAYISEKTGRHMAYYFVTDSNTIFAVVVSICSFMFFKNIKIRYNQFINSVASTTFGILCIHANSETMRNWLWNDTVKCVDRYNLSYFPLYAIACVIIIFSICSVIDLVRIHTLEKYAFKLWDKCWNKFLTWFNIKEEKVLRKLNVN